MTEQKIKPFNVEHDGKQYRVTGIVDYVDKQNTDLFDIDELIILLGNAAAEHLQSQGVGAVTFHTDTLVAMAQAVNKLRDERINELEEALQFYADEGNWLITIRQDSCGCCTTTNFAVKTDNGKRSKQALKGGEV